MQRFHNFRDFLLEKEVPMSPQLKTFTVQDQGDGKFSFEQNGSPVSFSVLPFPKDIEEYKTFFFQLTKAIEDGTIEDGTPVLMYETIEKAQQMEYDFGNLVSSSLSLNNVKELAVNLTDDQRNLLASSEKEFLKSNFSSLPKKTKDAVIEYLKDILIDYAIVLECLFYYARDEKPANDEKFYEGKDFFNILDEYWNG